jgi:hypothetical protein
MAGAGHDRLDPFGPFERGHLLSGEQLDPVRLVDGGDQRADLSAHHPLQRGLAGEDRGHLNAELRQRGRHLATDEPHADHDRAPTRHRLLLDRVALGRRTQIADPGQLSPVNPEPPVTRPRGYQGLLVADLLARTQDDPMRGRIDARDARAANVYAVFGVPAGRPDVPAVEVLFRSQVRLGQRRPAKRDARFRADDNDRPSETLIAQGSGRVAAREAAADDHDRASADALRHASPIRSQFPYPAEGYWLASSAP